MMESISIWRQFEDLVRRILQVNNFSFKNNDSVERKGFDFQAQISDETWAIEVKYYRTARPQFSLIEAAATHLVRDSVDANLNKGMLVVSCFLTEELRETLEQKFDIVFVDQVDLRNWCAKYPELTVELDALLEVNPRELHPRELHVEPNSFEDRTSNRKKITNTVLSDLNKEGTDLCEELKKINKGRGSWREYEKTCEKVLNYLFKNDLYGWHSQKSTEDGLSRYDYICRVRPTTEFWKFVIDHLSSRYILFEFKNYSEKIEQGQILTTEKYLLERGLRRMAIIMTRVGADPNAIAMAQGAMREHGKLILILNDEKVCKMLLMKERGEDPTDCLFEIADDFLMKLPR